MGVWVVVDEFEVFVFEIEDVMDIVVDEHFGEWAVVAVELFFDLIEVVEVDVGIAEGVDEHACPEPRHLGDHLREQGVGSDVERHAEEEVGRALVELAREPVRAFVFGTGDMELEEAVAGGQRHLVELCGVPRGDDVASGVGVGFDAFDEFGDLVEGRAIGACP